MKKAAEKEPHMNKTIMRTALGRFVPTKLNKSKGYSGKYRTVITYYSEDELFSMTFYGKQKNHSGYFRWRSAEAMHQYIDKVIENTKGNNALVAASKKKAMRPTILKPGDILGSCWGYEQTNWDFYEVTKVLGKRTVEIRPVAQERHDTEWLQGNCRPKPGHYTGEPIRKMVNTRYDNGGEQADQITIASYASAHKVDPQQWQHYTAYY